MYQDPGTPLATSEWTVPAGQTLALDLRNAGFPLGWSCIPAAGASVTHRGANAASPGDDDWLEPAENADITEATRSSEPEPVAWLRWAATGGSAKVAVTAIGPIQAMLS